MKDSVTGGSGSAEVLSKATRLGARNIISISRNEDLIKQAEVDVASPFVKFRLGDINTKNS